MAGVGHHAWLAFAFLVKTGFHHVGQDGLKLLTSGDPLASVSQSARITDVIHHTQSIYLFVYSRWSFVLVAQAGVQWHDLSSSAAQVQAILLPQLSE